MTLDTTTKSEETAAENGGPEFIRSKSNPGKTLYKASGEHLFSELNDEVVILNLKNGKYYGLNPVGARIWELLQEPVSVEKIERAILSEYDVDREVCAREVEEFLTLMRDEELIETADEPIVKFYQTAGGRKDTIY
jgi:hypothetical protein